MEETDGERLELGTFAVHGKPNQPQDHQRNWWTIPTAASCTLEVGDLSHIETFNADEAEI